MSYYAFLPYTQSPVLILDMLNVYFGGIIGAHTDEQQEVLVQGLRSFSTHPGYKTLRNSKTC